MQYMQRYASQLPKEEGRLVPLFEYGENPSFRERRGF
jgi:hypothetical protein